jgi:hypothetical protein
MASRAPLVAWVIAACSSSHGEPLARAPAVAAHVTDAASDAPASCIDDGKPYDENALRDQIAHLASTELDGRAPGTSGDIVTRAFIADRFRCLGLVPAGDNGTFEQAFDDTANVVGTIAGTGTDVIVIGAHHDHVGRGHLGANDNASGVVALLAVAQAIRQSKQQPVRTIAFVAFGDEENGMLGSTHFVAHPPGSLAIDHVVYDINLDMVGSYASKRAVYVMGTFAKFPARSILDALAKTHPKLSMGLGGRGERSDHAPFCDLGIPYVFFWTPDSRCYHATCDTVDNVDIHHMAEIAAVAGELVEKLANTDKDLAASRAKLGCGQPTSKPHT